jgi:hypothetical protein
VAVIEITTFRLGQGVGDEAFLKADERVRTGFLYQQPGLVRATTARSTGGEWLVVVLWDSDGDAVAAASLAETDPANTELMALIDRSTLERERYNTFD